MLNQAFRERAGELGFIAIGFSEPQTPVYFDFFVHWLREVEVGDMAYLRRNIDLRRDPRRLLEGLKTIISLAYPYPASKPSTPEGYTVSRYSTPQQQDYHRRLRGLGKQLSKSIKEIFPDSRSRICVDSAPILERSFALMAAIGFIGKNNMLIVPGHGSYCFLVEILTTAQFSIPSLKEPGNRCGSCTECIDSCPTGALKAPFYLDASKCLSYLTIESEDDIDKEIAGNMGNTFFGCDVCQEVCPFNRKGLPVVSLPSKDSIFSMTEIDFNSSFGKTALGRAGLRKLKRNLRLLCP
ncbi:MAG: tRNA epoxyqueuosine(34) reductase QueG [Desulfatiglandales bacterium]